MDPPTGVVLDILDRKGMPMHIDKTITNKEDFIRELANFKRNGFALDLEENAYGITCIAVPIFDHLGKVIAAVSISGPTMRMTDERLKHLPTRMLQVGKQISARLGFENRIS